MSKMWDFLLGFFSRRQEEPSCASRHRSVRPQKVTDYLELLHEHPGTRVTTVRLLGRRTADDNVLFAREHLETEDDEGNAREIDVYDARTCSFGHLLDQDVRATALCQTCGEVMCSTEDCTGWCCVCGSACCANHRIRCVVGGQKLTYCNRCRRRPETSAGRDAYRGWRTRPIYRRSRAR